MKLLDEEGLAAKGIPHGRIQLWRLVKAGKFPPPVKVGSRNCWVEAEIDEYIKKLVAERDSQAA
jgi:prophage regulatory protein